MRILTSLTALIIAGEALALFVGMVLRGEVTHPWRTPLNHGLLLVDFITGSLLLIALWIQPDPIIWLIWITSNVAIVAHAFRVWQKPANAPPSFCYNTLLQVVNWIKLAGLVLTVLACLPAN